MTKKKEGNTEETKHMVGSPMESIARRQQFGTFHVLMKGIKVEDSTAVGHFTRMDAQQFQYLLEAVSPLIVHKDTAMRDAISPVERLAVTLHF